MDARVEAALIAGLISIIIALISFLAAQAKTRSEIASMKLQQKHNFVEKLYSLRLDFYPEALEITQEIGKRSKYSDEEIIKTTKQAHKELTAWHRSKAGLLFSPETLTAYYALKELLKKQPSENGHYTTEQLEKLWYARNAFRGCLRSDVSLLHDS